MKQTGLQLALEKAGSQVRLAEVCGVTQPTVWGWTNKGNKRVPGEYVLTIERELGLSRHDIRPDLYPREGTAA